MTAREASKMKLSQSILEMKFMKRTREKVAQQLFDAEGKEYFENQLTTRMRDESGQYITEPSFSFCENLLEGRLSFRGMNPEIERILQHEENERQQVKLEKTPNNEMDVSDAQMAQHCLSSRTSTLKAKRKNWKKEESRQRSKKFKLVNS